MQQKNFYPLSRLIIRKIIITAIVCGVLIGGVQGFLSYRQNQYAFERNLNVVALVAVPQLSILIWDIEPEAIRRQLMSISDHNDISYVRLELANGRIFDSGRPHRVGDKEPYKFKIPSPDNRGGELATMWVYADTVNWYQAIFYMVALSIMGCALLTLLVCVLVTVILKRHLQRPMQDIVQFVSTLSPERILTPFIVQKKSGIGRNEIDLIEEGFSTFQRVIDQHIQQLDIKVAERTKQLESALASIQQLSITDQLTSCYNRNYLDQTLARMAQDDPQAERLLSVIFCDIDHFKLINDRFGHKAGDEVLRQIGLVFQQTLRNESDWVARYGGEEFLLVLPNTPLSDAAEVAERLRLAVHQLSFYFNQQDVTVTASFGLAQRQANEAMPQLLERADQQLYAAKNGGRNRIVY